MAYLDDAGYRRRILTQLNRGEARHSLARAAFYGKRGELHQAYREGQEDQLNALGLVVNAMVLWNTRYMGVAVDALREDGVSIDPEDLGRLSPLSHDHITMLGQYSFQVPESVAQGRLRPLMRLTRRSSGSPAARRFAACAPLMPSFASSASPDRTALTNDRGEKSSAATAAII